MATAEVRTRRDGRGAAATKGNGKRAPSPFRTSAGQPHPLGATPDKGGVNFSVFSQNATAIELQADGRGLYPGRFAELAATAGAVPAALSADGAAFSISWQQAAPAEPPQPDPFSE